MEEEKEKNKELIEIWFYNNLMFLRGCSFYGFPVGRGLAPAVKFKFI